MTTATAPPKVAAAFPLADFKAAFNAVARAVPSRTPRPVLLCVRLDLTPGVATFSSTNLELWLRHALPCDYAGEAASLLLARSTFADILRAASGETIALEANGAILKVAVGSRSWTIPTDDPAIFPDVPEMELGAYHEVDAEWLATAIRRVVKEARPGVADGHAASAIQFDWSPESIGLTSANGGSLAHQSVPAGMVGSPAWDGPLPLLPDTAIRTVQGLLSDADGPVQVGFPDANWAVFRVGRTTVRCRLAEGNFVDWRAYVARFPAPIGTTTVACKALRTAVACACISLDEQSRALLLKFTPAELQLSTGSSRGKSYAAEPIAWDGPEVERCLDPVYIKNMLAALGDDTPVTLSIMPGVNGRMIPLRIETGDGFLGLSQFMDKG